MNRWKYVLVGLLVGAFAFPLVWVSDPLVIGQTVTVDSTQSPLVVNALADLADLTPTDGQSVIIKTGTEKGLWYYDKDSVAVVDSVAVLTGPGSVGRFLVINNDAGSIAAATAITAAEIDNDVDIEFGVFDADSPRSLTLAELKKTGVQVVNVKQYGATGDGVTDDTTDIRAALTALRALGGGVLFFPAGTYLVEGTTSAGASVTISSAFDVGSEPILVLGVGRGVSIIKSKTTYPIRFFKGDEAVVGFSMRDITIEGNDLGDFSAGTALSFEIFTNISLVDCEFLNLTGSVMVGANDASTQSSGFLMRGCTVNGDDAYTASCVHLYNIRNVIVTNNLFEHVTRVFDLEVDTARSISDAVFSNNVVRDVDRATRTGNESGFPVHVELEDTCDARNIVIANNSFTDCHDDSVASLAGGVIGFDHNGTDMLSPIQVSTVAATDLVTATAHGLSNGTKLQFFTGDTLPGNVSANTVYYVVNKNDDDFQISTTEGGGALDITSNTTSTNFVLRVVVDDATANDFTLASHGLTNGRPVRFFTGGTIATGLLQHKIYWVVNATTDDFQVSETRGGSAVDLSAATTGVLSVTSPCVMENITIANNVIVGHNSNTTTNTIWVDNCDYVSIVGNVLRECLKTTARGIIFRDSSRMTIVGNVVDETYGTAFREMSGCRKNVVVGNRFKSTTFDSTTLSGSTNTGNVTGVTGF